MNGAVWIQVAMSVVSLIVVAVIVPLLTGISRARERQITVMSQETARQTEAIVGSIREVKEEVRAVGQKLDQHVQWHLEQDGRR